jgi:hypothetical protein
MVAPEHVSEVQGKNAIIKVPNTGGNEIAVTNVSFSINASNDTVQTNQGLKVTNVTTGLDYDGSFEYDGSQDKIRAQLFYSASDDAVQNGLAEAGQPIKTTMTVKERASAEADDAGNLPRTWTLEGMKVTGMSRDIPGDGIANSSWDFVADDAYVSSGGFDDGSSRN